MIFKKFYSSKSRLKFIKASLKSLNGSLWKVINRKNVLACYPSDFDVIQVSKVLSYPRLNFCQFYVIFYSVILFNIFNHTFIISIQLMENFYGLGFNHSLKVLV